MEFSARFKMAREYAGLNQTELAEKVGITQQMVSRIETGKVKGTTEIVKVALVCKVNVYWLAEGIGEMVDEMQLTEEERAHLQLFREASEKTRRSVCDALESEKQINELNAKIAELERKKA